MKKYVIESDGTVQGTKLVVNGSEISGASSITFEMYANEREVDVKIRFQDKEQQPSKRIGF